MNEAGTVAAGQGAARRPLCPRCERPLLTCLCDLVVPVLNPLPVPVLQHPLEARQAKGSLPLLRLSLAQCQVLVGEQFDPDLLARSLRPADGGRSLLLYPDVPAAPAPCLHRPGALHLPAHRGLAEAAAGRPGPAFSQLVVLDATWRKSLKLLLSHPALQALPRMVLGLDSASAYGLLRQARDPRHRSTLEATCLALAALEGEAAAQGAQAAAATEAPPGSGPGGKPVAPGGLPLVTGRYAGLLGAFDRWVARQARRAG